MENMLLYPIDSNYIIRKKNMLRKALASNNYDISLKIAILGGSTTSEIKNCLEIFLLNEGIKVEFYESDYNKYYEDALFSKDLESFSPDVIYIHTNYRNIERFPDIYDSDDIVQDLLNHEIDKYTCIWKSLKDKFNCVIIQNNFEYPKNRIMGNYDRTAITGRLNFINRLNEQFSFFARNNSGFYINDINYLSALIGLDKWEDSVLWYSYKYAISYDSIVLLSKSIANIIKSIYGKNKKCLVLDLDNTLWGGVIGEDGVEHIRIGNESAEGEAYADFQKYLLQLKKMGVSLAIASKNDEVMAKEGLDNKNMLLKESDFINIKANWNSKDLSIREIASEINIGLDSIVFVDDNPAERSLVNGNIDGVSVPDIGDDIIDYIKHIDRNGYFEVTNLSLEDSKRAEYYEKNKIRENESKKFLKYEDFLKSLDMIADIGFAKDEYIDRIVQLINKTNQFNLTTKRYRISDVENFIKSDNYIVVYGRLKDKYGDNGLVTVVIGKIFKNELYIDIWLMSCRVLKRDLEKAVFDFIVEYCKNNDIKTIHGCYLKTKKNGMVEDFYSNLGFTGLFRDDVKSEWLIDVSSIDENQNNVIKVGEY